MADQKEPKKETVRITLPPRVPPNSAEGAVRSRETVRINLPARPPASGIVPRPPVSAPTPPTAPPSPVSAPTFLPPQSPAAAAPRPPASPSVPLAAAAMPAPEPGPVSPGPKKETARITVLPDPPKSSGSVQMKKTQPLISMPSTAAPVTPVKVAPAAPPAAKVEAISMPLCWALLGTSAAILLIQIWNYLS
jgi:hypothetical protein